MKKTRLFTRVDGQTGDSLKVWAEGNMILLAFEWEGCSFAQLIERDEAIQIAEVILRHYKVEKQ